jgi:hypothetical protein
LEFVVDVYVLAARDVPPFVVVFPQFVMDAPTAAPITDTGAQIGRSDPFYYGWRIVLPSSVTTSRRLG